MATYKTNDQLITVTTKRTVPDIQQTLTGTFTAASGSKYILGTGSLLFSEVGGDQGVGYPSTAVTGWLLDLTNSEFRKIVDVLSNTECVIQSAFSNAQSGATLYYVPESKATALGIACVPGGGIVNGTTLPAGFFNNYGSDQDTGYSCDPLLIDGSGGAIQVSIMYKGSNY